MKNFLQLFAFVLIIALFGACTSTNNLTHCPDFKSKNKPNKSIALKFKKKQNKKHRAIVKQNRQLDTKTQLAKATQPLETIVASNITNNANETFALSTNSTFNLNNYINEELLNKINVHLNSETTTASLETIIEETSAGTLENLGIAEFVKNNATKPLSKKEIKKLERKVAKFEKKLTKLSEKTNSLPVDGAPGQKSQLIALILVIVAGAIGVHRFYLGYTGIGIAQILTAGGCGIWALIDLINIITGNLKPADGSDYDPETLIGKNK